MSQEHLKQLYVEQLRDLYAAETQLLGALPALRQAVHDAQLRGHLEERLAQLQRQLGCLVQIFAALNETPGGGTCLAMQGLVCEGEEAMRTHHDPGERDAAISTAAQRMERHETADYGAVWTSAERLGETEAARWLACMRRDPAPAGGPPLRPVAPPVRVQVSPT